MYFARNIIKIWYNIAMSKCPYCNTTYNEILQTGFVGCSHCYQEIPELKLAVKKMYGDKKHKGKKVGGNGNI